MRLERVFGCGSMAQCRHRDFVGVRMKFCRVRLRTPIPYHLVSLRRYLVVVYFLLLITSAPRGQYTSHGEDHAYRDALRERLLNVTLEKLRITSHRARLSQHRSEHVMTVSFFLTIFQKG